MRDMKKKVRNANVQYLRGIGILAIVMYHFPMFYKLIAVDYIQKYMRFGQAFFVIAGYFIAEICHIPIILLVNYFLRDTEIYNNVPVYFALVMFCIGTVGMLSKKYIESI